MDRKPVRHLITLDCLSIEDIESIVSLGESYACGATGRELAGCSIGVLFTLTSTRTRTAFTVAAHRLGARVISYGPADLQTNTGETIGDTARVLASMLDGLILRTTMGNAELRSIASQVRMACVNAMSRDEHPTQALSDLVIISRRVGGLRSLRMLYLGEGNNTAVSLALAVARIPGARLSLRTPAGYGLPTWVLAAATSPSASGEVEERHDLDDLPKDVDVVYTTRWQTTGTQKVDPNWRVSFEPFRVTSSLMNQFPEALFMHDLPAHRGDEVEAAVLDGPRSIAFEQAESKLYGAMAVLAWCLQGPID